MSLNKKQESEVCIDIVIKGLEDISKHYDYIDANGIALNYELEEHILKTLRSYPLSKRSKLVVHIPEDGSQYESNSFKKIIHHHFISRVKEVDIFLKEQFRQWRVNMVIGTLFLVLCLILVEVLDKFSHVNVIRIIKESLMIVGWVALWDPLTFILFGYRNIRQDRNYYKKLCSIPVTVETYHVRKSGPMRMRDIR